MKDGKKLRFIAKDGGGCFRGDRDFRNYCGKKAGSSAEVTRDRN
jgi:hypothetical protein